MYTIHKVHTETIRCIVVHLTEIMNDDDDDN